MTNLDSILKSRDIALLTNNHMVKVMFFSPIKWESWTIKKLSTKELTLELTLLSYGAGEDSWESFG